MQLKEIAVQTRLDGKIGCSFCLKSSAFRSVNCEVTGVDKFIKEEKYWAWPTLLQQ